MKLKIIFCSILVLLLTACKDDINFRTSTTDSASPGLRIKIPNVKGAANFAATRDGVTADVEAHESDISDLWMVACDAENGNGSPIVINLLEKNTSDSDSGEYETYTVDPEELPGGKYDFYILANVIKFIPEQNKKGSGNSTAPFFESKDAVDNLTLLFGNYINLDENPLMPENDGSMYLPMACLPLELKSGETKSPVTSAVEYVPGYGLELYADLTFLVAKVRYTILFNNDDSDSNAFSSFYDDLKPEFLISPDNSGPTVSNVRNSTLLSYNDENFTYDESFIQRENSNSQIWSIPLYKADYPDVPTYPSLTDGINGKSIARNLDEYSGSTWSTDKKRAWQGIVYLPENRQSLSNVRAKSVTGKSFTEPDVDLLSESNPMTYLSFPATVGDYKVTFRTTLEPLMHSVEGNNDSDFAANGIKRGNFYDICSKVASFDAEFLQSTVSVSKWTQEELKYRLHGEYELVIENTNVEVSSREPAVFWYRSDIAPGDIEFESPLITFTNLEGESTEDNFYSMSVYTDENGDYILNSNGEYQIQVKINPAIPVSVLQDVNSNANGYLKSDFQYFEIIAGNLHKKVTVDPLGLDAMLEINPKEIIIDVRELISSGEDSGYINFEIETNINTTVQYECSADGIMDGNGVLWISALGNSSIDTNASLVNISNGIGRLRLNFKDIFKGDIYWKEKRTITLKFTATAGSYNADDTLTIIVNPYNTDYTIHFKPLKGDWTNPHIYVYQCLEMPRDLKESDANYQWRGKTVGYGDSNSHAGLEYAFTNNISFRGWKGFGGNVDPNEPNTNYKYGFVHLGGENEPGGDLRFNPMYGNTTIYNFSTDLNSAHYANHNGWVCDKCKQYVNPEDYNRTPEGYGKHLFAGITMEKETGENEGWYKYTLSGVATPGKAMVMFYDDHDWTGTEDGGPGNNRRYPNVEDGKDPVGIPLFDYPDREGWITYDGNQSDNSQNFYDEKPETSETEVTPSDPVYMFYWPITQNQYIHLWIEGGKDFTDYDSNTGEIDWNLGYYYYPIPEYQTGDLYYILNKKNNSNIYAGTMDQFQQIGQNFHAYVTTTKTTLTGGKPDPLWNKSSYLGIFYLKGEMNNWGSDLEFMWIYEYNNMNVYKLENVNLTDGTQYKIGNDGWSVNLGGQGNDGDTKTKPGDSITLYYSSSSKNIEMQGDFKGTMYLMDDGKDFILYLVNE